MAIGAAAFAALVWGSVGLVVLAFLYELYAVLRDLGLRPGAR
ncbi:MAG: hypothetical protein ABEI39_02750 [Halobacteriales archaeon]